MGYQVHNAIVLTSNGVDHKGIKWAHKLAREMFGKTRVSELSPEVTNGFRTFVIAPCGSKEGWCEDEQDTFRRKQFWEKVVELCHPGKNHLFFSGVEVRWEENGKACVVKKYIS